MEDSSNNKESLSYNEEIYGPFSNNLHQNTNDRFYITTAIAYTNGLPHLGHAYEFLTADVISRCNRVLGKEVFFVTGTDEHGQKVAASAEANNKTPLDHCNFYVDCFKKLDEKLLVSYSHFQRTTDVYHEQTSQRLWELCAKKGDIYLDSYEGWYNEREEAFVPLNDAEANNFKDPSTGKDLKLVKEESYFFRMSKYTEKLIDYIENVNPNFIQPEFHKNQILHRLKHEGLKDLSISRTSFSWGIPVPKGFNEKHVMYVWFDALTNYITGVHGLDKYYNEAMNLEQQPEHPLSSYWPAQCHLIGKDIIWFHCVIWPCMLMSAEIPLPQSVFSHGFVNASDGRKMSKSFGNSVDPFDLINKYSVDLLRYYLCNSITFGADINFNEENLIMMNNSELADILGNLVHRILNLTHKYCDGKVPEINFNSNNFKYSDEITDEKLREQSKNEEILASISFPFNPIELATQFKDEIEGNAGHNSTPYSLNNALLKVMDSIRATNKFLTDTEPWKLKKDEEIYKRNLIIRITLEAVYFFSNFLSPFLPSASGKIFQYLNTKHRDAKQLNYNFNNLLANTPITLGHVLFNKIETEKEAATTGKGKAAPAPTFNYPNEFAKLDIRVGEILSINDHPSSPTLFVEEIHIGYDEKNEKRIIQVVSNLKNNYSKEDLLNRKVIVLTNLKESKFKGVMSYGMLLAAKKKEKKEIDGEEKEVEEVDLLVPSQDSKVGEKVYLKDQEEFKNPLSALAPNQIKKEKVWEKVSLLLKTGETGQPLFENLPLQTESGPLESSRFFGVIIG